MTTFPPAAAICFAVAAPTPEEEPVTMAMVCSNFIVTLLPVITVPCNYRRCLTVKTLAFAQTLHVLDRVQAAAISTSSLHRLLT